MYKRTETNLVLPQLNSTATINSFKHSNSLGSDGLPLLNEIRTDEQIRRSVNASKSRNSSNKGRDLSLVYKVLDNRRAMFQS